MNLFAGDLPPAFDAFGDAASIRFAREAYPVDAMKRLSLDLLSVADDKLKAGSATDALIAYFHGYVLQGRLAERGAADLETWRYLRGLAETYVSLGDQATARHFYDEAISLAVAAPSSSEYVRDMLRRSQELED